MEITKIKQLRVFEKMVTSCILKEFNNYLNSERKTYLSENSLIPDNYENEFTSAENIQGEVFRLVLSKVFENILCEKEFSFSDGTNTNIKYGELLHEGLVIYFSEALSLKYNLAIDEVNNAEEKIIFVRQIRESLENNFKPLVFTCDAKTILSVVNKEDLTKICDNDAVKRYLSQKQINEQKVIEESNNKDNELVENQNLNDINKNIVSTETELTKNENKLSEDFTQEESKENTYVLQEEHTNNNNSHNTKNYEDNDELLTYTNKYDNLYSDFADISQSDLIEEEEKTELTDNNGNIRLISTDEYTKICMKSVNGKTITPEELKLLEYYDLHNFGENEQVNKNDNKKYKVTNINKPVVNAPTKKLKKAGFTQKLVPLLIVAGVIILGIVCGMAIFKLKGM